MGKNTAYTEIYHDDNIVVLNKSSGILTAADRYNPDIPRLDLEAEKNLEDYLPFTESTRIQAVLLYTHVMLMLIVNFPSHSKEDRFKKLTMPLFTADRHGRIKLLQHVCL